MLCAVSFDSLWRRRERIRYWVRERSDWRIERVRLVVAAEEVWWCVIGSVEEAARSSMDSIFCFICIC